MIASPQSLPGRISRGAIQQRMPWRFQGGAHRIRDGAILMGIADKNIMGHGYFLPEV